MYVCMHACTCVEIYVYIYVHACINKYMNENTHIHICIFMYIHSSIPIAASSFLKPGGAFADEEGLWRVRRRGTYSEHACAVCGPCDEKQEAARQTIRCRTDERQLGICLEMTAGVAAEQ